MKGMQLGCLLSDAVYDNKEDERMRDQKAPSEEHRFLLSSCPRQPAAFGPFCGNQEIPQTDIKWRSDTNSSPLATLVVTLKIESFGLLHTQYQ